MTTPLDASKTRPLDGGASFSLGNRIFRVWWSVCWLLLARFTPPPFHRWRSLVLRAFGARLGSRCRIHGSVKIWHPRNLVIGDRVLVGPGARLYNQGRIEIGEGTVISQRAHLCASTHALEDPNFQLLLRPINIGKNCWVAAEAFVGPGASMSDGAVLGARGCLFGRAEQNSVYGGNPAKYIKSRG